jgi:hypothetical protein
MEEITVYHEHGSNKSGHGYRDDHTNKEYDIIREANTPDGYYSDYWSSVVSQWSKQATGYPYRIDRSFLYFDTSEIPSNAIVTEAKLYLQEAQTYIAGYWSPFRLVIQKGIKTPWDDPEYYPHYPWSFFEDWLYNQYEGDYGGLNITTAPVIDNNYVITLTDFGVITPGGMTKLVLRNENDINGTPPPNDKNEGMSFYMTTEYGGTPPYMIIKYELVEPIILTTISAERSRVYARTILKGKIEEIE